MATNPKGRFSNRVEDYVKYRPGYPKEILSYLQDEFGLNNTQMVVDIGAGTGISTALFLEAGYHVIAVEPNREMREKSVELLSHFTKLITIDGNAEHTTLANEAADLIVAGQAFHWFDPEESKKEFSRILKPGGRLAIIWNERKVRSPFEMEYEKLIIKHGTDYEKIDHRNINDRDIESFFSPRSCLLKIFDNFQLFDFEGLRGRLLSSSYMPALDAPGYQEMVVDLASLFQEFNRENQVRIGYDTKLYAGFFK